MSEKLDLSPAVFSILSALVEEKVGLHYNLLDREILQEKASHRASEAGFNSLLDYYYFLRYDDNDHQELRELTETLVVNETYFFREWRAIEIIVDTFIAPLVEQGKSVRVWSAACATGEEPLSLAMLLHHRKLLSQVQIIATDISERALTKAQRGIFGKRSIRQLPSLELYDKYVTPAENGYTISRELIDAVRWQRKNLLSDEDIQELGLFDIVLCRNVLIYFADQTVKNVLDRLGRALVPKGKLVVGVSESLTRYGSGFNGEEHGGAFVYCKNGELR